MAGISSLIIGCKLYFMLNHHGLPRFTSQATLTQNSLQVHLSHTQGTQQSSPASCSPPSLATTTSLITVPLPQSLLERRHIMSLSNPLHVSRPTGQISRFLNLPPEIRHLIRDIVISSELCDTDGLARRGKRVRIPSLIAVCKDIHQQCITMFFSQLYTDIDNVSLGNTAIQGGYKIILKSEACSYEDPDVVMRDQCGPEYKFGFANGDWNT